MLQNAAPRLDPREQHYWIAGSRAGLRLFLRRLSPAPSTAGCVRPVLPVLYVHGATFSSGLSIAHRFDGFSWRDALCAAGFDVLGSRFSGLRPFRSLSRDGRSARRARRPLPYRGRRRPTRDGGALQCP